MHDITLLKPGTAGDWQAELASAITDAAELLQALGLEHLENELVHNPAFRLLVPRSYVAKMYKRDANDPLLRQVLPLGVENNADGVTDPVGDLTAMTTPGLLHKYSGRVLLVVTGACAIHCRYCFRRHFPYSGSNPRKHGWQQAIDYIQRHNDICEVILSGGDPLVLDNANLARLLDALEQISHVEWLRIHTRLPVILPSRIDDGLVALLSKLRFRTTLVIHANHANELMSAEFEALQRLLASGLTLLNQSVLLKGVNDSASTLVTLSRRLHQAGVLPYYLHMLDPVQGAMHFDVPPQRALAIHNKVRAELPGYLVPQLVREIPGARSKTAIFTI